MIVHKCDFCGEVMNAWVSIKIEEGSAGAYAFVGSLDNIAYTNTEICFKCFEDKVLPILRKE